MLASAGSTTQYLARFGSPFEGVRTTLFWQQTLTEIDQPGSRSPSLNHAVVLFLFFKKKIIRNHTVSWIRSRVAKEKSKTILRGGCEERFQLSSKLLFTGIISSNNSLKAFRLPIAAFSANRR